MKRRNRCGKRKSPKAFSVRSVSKDRLLAHCKTCHRKYIQERSDRLKVEGRCRTCGDGPVMGGSGSCETCYFKYTARRRLGDANQWVALQRMFRKQGITHH